jgi:hypothetical protein
MIYQVDLTYEQHFKLYNDFLHTMELNTISNYFSYIKQKYNATVLEYSQYCLEFDNEKDYNWFLLQL